MTVPRSAFVQAAESTLSGAPGVALDILFRDGRRLYADLVRPLNSSGRARVVAWGSGEEIEISVVEVSVVAAAAIDGFSEYRSICALQRREHAARKAGSR